MKPSAKSLCALRIDLPIVKDLIETFTHTSIDELERYEGGSRTILILKKDEV
jgi:hypothetical protein